MVRAQRSVSEVNKDPESGVQIGLMCGLPQGWGASIHRLQVWVGTVLNKWRRWRSKERSMVGKGHEGIELEG